MEGSTARLSEIMNSFDKYDALGKEEAKRERKFTLLRRRRRDGMTASTLNEKWVAEMEAKSKERKSLRKPASLWEIF
jgi:hypothetical protein